MVGCLPGKSFHVRIALLASERVPSWHVLVPLLNRTKRASRGMLSDFLPWWTSSLGGSFRLIEMTRVVGVSLPFWRRIETDCWTSAAESGSSGCMADLELGEEKMGTGGEESAV